MSLSQAAESGRCVSVVMLTLNEEGAIGKVCDDIRRELPEAEIVVVDSSTDRTPEIAKEKGCVLVRQFPPAGYGNAMHAAFQAAGREYVVTIDCDDTYPIEDIKKMLVQMEAGCDLVSASRLPRKPDAMHWPNYIANVGFCWLSFLICGVQSTDVHTGMRTYRKSLLETFPYDPIGMALPVELQIGPAALGYKCHEMFIEYRPRIGESKLVPLPGTIWTLKRIWRWRMFFNPHRQRVAQQLAVRKA
jgi:glycosyltransferase involved in cell wall biosynthesis